MAIRFQTGTRSSRLVPNPASRADLREMPRRPVNSDVCAGNGALLLRCKSDGQVCRAEREEGGREAMTNRLGKLLLYCDSPCFPHFHVRSPR